MPSTSVLLSPGSGWRPARKRRSLARLPAVFLLQGLAKPTALCNE